jgi:hypothetical protein
MGENPLKKMIDGEDGPEFEYGSDFGGVVVHEELKSVESGNVEGQKLTTLWKVYLTNSTMLWIIDSNELL